MERAERIGLGVAGAGHLILFGLLSVGFLATPNPEKLKQQPIDVSLVKDVGLEPAAPQAVEEPAQSIAPETGEPDDAAPPAAATVASRKMLVAILVTFVFEVTVGHVIEFLKILMQTSDGSQTYLQLLGRITSEKGIVGIWDGFLPWGVVQCIGKGGVFGMTHAVAQGVLLPMSDAGALSPLIVVNSVWASDAFAC